MTSALILLPYANPHLAMFYSYVQSRYHCDFYIHSNAHAHRQHVIIEGANLPSITYNEVKQNLKRNKYSLVFSHGAFYPFIKALLFCNRTCVFLLSEQLQLQRGSLVRRTLKKQIVRRLASKHDLQILALGPETIGINYSTLAGRQLPTFAYGYFPDWAVIPNSRAVLSEPINIVFAGQFIDRKNIKILLSALNLSKAIRDGRAKITFAGDGPLKEFIAHHTAAACVGMLTRAELIQLLSASDILILPSREEGWGAIVNEAAACGCALMLTPKVVAGHMFMQDGDTGFIVSEKPEDIAYKIDILAADLQRLASMKANAQAQYAQQIANHDQNLDKIISHATTGTSL